MSIVVEGQTYAGLTSFVAFDFFDGDEWRREENAIMVFWFHLKGIALRHDMLRGT
jgi:hypothetical protein